MAPSTTYPVPPPRDKWYPGMRIYNWVLIQRIPDKPKSNTIMRNRWRVECQCDSHTRCTLPSFYLTRPQPKKDCGCSRKTIKTHYPQEYGIWLMMHVRTEDPRHVAYKHYGGRGIRVCAEWHKSRGEDGFRAFLEYVGPRPSKGHSIDRVDNDLGYQPFQGDGVTRQVRWATARQQRMNQRGMWKDE